MLLKYMTIECARQLTYIKKKTHIHQLDSSKYSTLNSKSGQSSDVRLFCTTGSGCSRTLRLDSNLRTTRAGLAGVLVASAGVLQPLRYSLYDL